MKITLIERSIVGSVTVETGDDTPWNFSAEKLSSADPEVELWKLSMTANEAAVPREFTLKWSFPEVDLQYRWFAGHRYAPPLPADWWTPISTSLATCIPMMEFSNLKGENRFLFALSDAKQELQMQGGLHEEDNSILCKIKFFTRKESPVKSYSVQIRFDRRRVFYADAIRDNTAWYETFPEYKPAPVPDAAFEPFYSSWYSYHQNVFADKIEAECREAAKFGLKTIILDDGWQTEDNNRGYVFCGDWEVAKMRFPDMRAHVDAVHKTGLRYMVWFSVPFVGKKSKNFTKFEGKYVNKSFEDVQALDPRFPEVREFLIGTWEKAVREWNLDGLKLDFIDSFQFNSEDPAIAEDYKGRDILSLAEAVDRLMVDAMTRLSALKPGILIEFRQTYIGPAIRKYGNLFRAGDCPADAITNRMRTIDLRLTSGSTAVHSDMLEWHYDEKVEDAALQFLNILFSVPQISMRLAELKEDHKAMLKFWLDFWVEHRDLLMKGRLMPYHLDAGFSLVTTEKNDEFLAALYEADLVVRFPEGFKTAYLVNATAENKVICQVQKAAQAEITDTCGRKVGSVALKPGLNEVQVPRSGLMTITF